MILMMILISSAFAQQKNQEIDHRIWSKTYWMKLAEQGLVEVAPQSTLTPAVYTGSKMNARTVLVDDGPDVLVLPAGVDPGTTTQSENSVFVNPLDNDKVFNSNNSTPWPVAGIFGTSGIVSTDGGATWGGQIEGTGGSNSGDPAAVIDLSGVYRVGYIAANSGNGAAFSTDEGATWTHVQVAPNPGSLADKNHLWVDNSPTSPHEGNLYATWTDFGGPNDSEIVISRSTDGGLTWSPRVNISSAVNAGSHNQGVHTSTASNGDVYVFWTVYDAFPADETAMAMAKSTDGGATFSPATRIITNIRGIRSSGTSKNHRVASVPVSAIDISGGARDGHIYLVWANIGVPGVNTGSDIDGYIIKSTDGGANWSTPVKINQDPSGQGKEHYFQWITCDPETGNLSVIFYDDRNVSSTQCEVFVANSLDGGSTWEDFKVSDVSFTPAPIPGLAGGYMGDYLAISARGSKVYPVWTDNRAGNVLTYTSPFVLADPDDPNPPSNVNAASDHTTPNSILLSWTDPTTLVDGSPIGDFTVEIERDGSPIASVASGTESFNDVGANKGGGLVDGQLYEYALFTKLTSNDSTSLVVNVSKHAGGHPVPAAPTNLACEADETSATLTWSDPTTQVDGEALDDLDHINVYRNGSLIASVSPGDETFTDTPPEGFVYTYHVTAVDNENPENESANSNSENCFVGSTPDYLVWVGPNASSGSADSGDSLLVALGANGESSFLTNDLFEFGSDLSAYKAIFVVLGIFSNNHVLAANGAEATALETYLQNGGCVYVEGGDCFNYDPESAGGHQVRPWFGLNDGPDGTSDVSGVDGENELAGFNFAYNGENNWMDELQPAGSSVIWGNNANVDNSGVFFEGFGGRAIGVVPSFGGMTDPGSAPSFDPVRGIGRAGITAGKNGINRDKSLVERTPNTEPFIKKAVDYPELKANRKPFEELIYKSGGSVQIMANNQTDLMAAYLALFDHGGGGGGSYTKTYAEGWNLAALSLNSTETDYTVLFPDAASNPMFGWGGTYSQETNLAHGSGYWLNFTTQATVTINGDVLNDLTISLTEGWNMIGGPSCNVAVGDIVDQGGIISSDFFGFDGGYFSAATIDQGCGYWIRASADGDIVMDCNAGKLGKTYDPNIVAGMDLRELPALHIEDAAGFGQRLFYNVSLDETVSKTRFSLPPLLPNMKFDARFAGGFRLVEGEEALI